MTISRGSQCEVEWAMRFLCAFFNHNHYTFLLAFTVLLSSFSNTVGAPVEEEPWWTHPCTGQVTGQMPQYRHARSGRSPVDTQFGILSSRMQNTVLKELEALYQKKPRSKMGNTCPKINAVLKLMNRTRNDNLNTMNHIFYDSIVELGKFVHMMKITPVNTRGKFDHQRRRDIYHEIEINLRNVLCEFNETLEGSSPPGKYPVKRIISLLSAGCLPKSMDLTKAQILDYDVIRKLRRFFNQGRTILKKAKQNRRRERRLNNHIDLNHKRVNTEKVKKGGNIRKKVQRTRSRHNKRKLKKEARDNSAQNNQ